MKYANSEKNTLPDSNTIRMQYLRIFVKDRANPANYWLNYPHENHSSRKKQPNFYITPDNFWMLVNLTFDVNQNKEGYRK